MSTSFVCCTVFFAVVFIGLSSAQSPPSQHCDDNEVYESCWRRRYMPESECNSSRDRICEPRCRCKSGYSRYRGRCIPSRQCPIVRNPREDKNETMANGNSTMGSDNSTMSSNTTMGNSTMDSKNNSSSMNLTETDYLAAPQLIVNLTLSPLCEKNATDGFYPIKENCSQFVLCVIGTGTILDCPQADHVFSNETRQCVPKDQAPEPCGTGKKVDNGSAKNETANNSTSLQSVKDFEPLCKAKGGNGLFLDPKACSRAIACLDSKAFVYECGSKDNKPFFNSTSFQCMELPEDIDKECVAQPIQGQGA